jgi:MtN3 and saliva related transmembrane protein
VDDVEDIAGWVSVGLGQLVSWPQVLKLRCESGEGISLASYAIVLVSMTLFLMHGITISDAVTIVSVPLALVPNLLIAGILIARRNSSGPPRAIARGACSRSKTRTRHQSR